MSKIYAMILCHNCEKLLPIAYEKIPKNYFDKIFVTDDGSTDNSISVANNLGIEVTSATKSGYGANVKHGLNYAFKNGADYVVEVHGDGAQFNPKAIIPAMKYIDKKYDFIIGSRLINIKRSLELKIPIPRLIANYALSYLDRMILGIDFTEFHTGFRIYGKKFSQKVFKRFSDDYLFSFEIIAWAAFIKSKCAEVPVECDYISDHTSHSYIGASIYALQHFKTLFHYIVSTKTKIKLGIFDND